MTVRELIELNQMITDAEIEIRENGSRLVEVLLIGCAEGKLPPCPRKVPVGKNIEGGLTDRRLAHYIDKSINAWDDGRDYWQVKPDRIPKAWQGLTVFSWEVWPASILGNPRRTTGHSRNVNFHGQRINIVVLPDGQEKPVEESKAEASSEQDDGQTNIFDFIS